MPVDSQSNSNKEIMGQAPFWLTRSGSGVLLIVILSFFLFSFFIKYPETIQSTVSIAADSEPILVISRSSGMLELRKEVDSMMVTKGQVLGYIKNEIDYESFLNVKKYLHTLDVNKRYSYYDIGEDRLGALGATIKDLNLAIEEYHEFLEKSLEKHQQKSIKTELLFRSKLLSKQTDLLVKERENLLISKQRFKRDSLLHEKGVMSAYDYMESYKSYLSTQSGLDRMDKERISLESSINDLNNRYDELSLTFEKKSFDILGRVKVRKKTIEEWVENWEYKQVIKAPVDGRVYFHKIMENHQQVSLGDELVYVVPESSESYAYAYVNQSGFGKVEKGQLVLLRMDDFPYQEFGVVSGELNHISPVYTEDGYLVKISLPKGLKTNYSIALPYTHHMTGSCEIITKDLRLIERFFFQFNSVFSKYSTSS